jgi:hypothetical protein
MPGKNIKFLQESRVKLNFTRKAMTSYGGFAVLAKVFEKLKLRQNIERMFPITERSPNSKGVYGKVVRFGLTVMAGGKRFSHCLFLGESVEIYKELFGLKKMTVSVTSLTRFFGRFVSWQKTQVLAEEMWEYMWEQIIDAKEDYLTFDSSVVTRYGSQEGAKKGYNPKKKGRVSHHPMLAFLNASGYIVNLWNRSGDTVASNNCVGFAQETIARIKGRMKILGCLADSGFYYIGIVKYLEELGLEYVIAAKLLRSIQQAVLQIEHWNRVGEGIDVAEFDFEHKDEKWDKKRRYVVVRHKVEAKKPLRGRQLSLYKEDEAATDYRFGIYVTSSKKSAEEIWRTYRLRARDEGVIKEFKQDFGFEGFCLQQFYATEAAMLTRALFYNIMTLFRRIVLPKKETRLTMQTLRMKYLVIPAFFGRDGHDQVLRLGVRSRKLRQKILWLINRLEAVWSKRNAFAPGG